MVMGDGMEDGDSSAAAVVGAPEEAAAAADREVIEYEGVGSSNNLTSFSTLPIFFHFPMLYNTVRCLCKTCKMLLLLAYGQNKHTYIHDFFGIYLLIILFNIDEVLLWIVWPHPSLADIVANLRVFITPVNGHAKCSLKKATKNHNEVCYTKFRRILRRCFLD
jgi:hypothetical protein